MYRHLPTTLLLLLGQLIAQTLGSASLVPPTVSLNQTSTGTLPTTSGVSATITGTSGSSSSSTSTTATSTTTSDFPSLSNVPSCISNCLDTAISRVGCSSVIDVNCFCVKPNFTSELVACILADCSDQLSASETLAQQFCNVATLSPSLSFPPGPTTTSSSTTTSDTTTTTAPPTTFVTPTASSAANSRKGYISQETTLGLIISAFGLIFGASIVL